MKAKVSKKEFPQLVRQHVAAVMDLAARLLPDRQEAEEVVQDAFFKAFQQLDTFRGDSSFLTWVQRIAYHEALSHLRRRQPYMVELSEIQVVSEDEDFSTRREERILLMEEAVGHLPADDQLLLHLFYYEDQPLQEIAYIMEAEPNTLSQRLRRIRKRLMMIIKQKEDEQAK